MILLNSVVMMRGKEVVDVNNLKNGRKPVKLQKGSPSGCAGEAGAYIQKFYGGGQTSSKKNSLI